ncbi:MAG: hypothetical protein WC401_03540 [Bacteroidales bacterium]|jgi:hypothetical protein
MIPIKINNKKYRIKPIDHLTTKEFIEFAAVENPDLVKYIAWQAGVKMDDAFFATTSAQLEKAVGKMQDVTTYPRPHWPDYRKGIDTVGQRHQVESCSYTGFELLVFCLAVAQARSNNIDDVEKLRASYLDRQYLEILPAGFFFFNSYRTGRKPGLKFLRKLLSWTAIKK